MKKRKEPTVPLSCRVSPALRRKYEEAAASMGMSLAEYTSLMVNIAEYADTGAQELERRLVEATGKLSSLEGRLRQEQAPCWNREPMASMLGRVLENERVLEGLYTAHGEQPIPVGLLTKAGFRVNALLEGRREDGLHFYFTGLHGWAFTCGKQRQVIIRRRG